MFREIAIHECSGCGETGSADQFEDDQISLLCSFCGCDVPQKPVLYISATWWSVAIYVKRREYGGPEEGGWYYNKKFLSNHEKVRCFADYDEAMKYRDELMSQYDMKHHAVEVFVEKFPEKLLPKQKPIYC